MNLSVYDKDLNRISIIGHAFKSCLWSEGYNSMQPFTLELDATEEYKKKIKEDYYVGRADRKTLMIIKTVKTMDNKIVATGYQATRVLDDVAFIGTTYATSAVDRLVISSYNRTNKYRKLKGIVTALNVKFDHQISNKSMLKLCNIACQSTDVGYRVILTDDGMGLELYQPNEKKNLVFSEVFGNLSVGSLTRSTEKYKNYAVVLGYGEGEKRAREIVDLSAGQDHREMIVDARDLKPENGETSTSYSRRLYERGVEKLMECKATRDVLFSPLSKDFGTKFDLGDVLTVVLPDYDMIIKARVSRFTQKEQQNQTITTIDVGEITILR